MPGQRVRARIRRWLGTEIPPAGPSTLALVAASIALAVVLFEPVYIWGRGNQASQIPLIRHAIDPTHLAADWTVRSRTGWTSPRFAYVQGMALLGGLVGVHAALAAVYVVGTLASLWLLYRIADTLFESRLVALVVVGFVLSPLTSLVDLGGNALVNRTTIPTTIANPLILAGIYGLLERRRVLAYLALGAASAIHLVNGLVMTGILVLADTVRALPERPRPRADHLVDAVPWRALAVWALVALPFLAPVAWENLANPAPAEAVTVMAWLRHPHHYVPSTWPRVELLATTAFTALTTGLLLAWPRRFVPSRHVRFLVTYVLGLVGAFLFAAFATEVVRIDTIVKLQVFHVDDLLFVPLVGIAASAGLRILARAARLSRIPARTLVPAAVVLAVLAGIGVQAHGQGVPVPGIQGPDPSPDRAETYRWIAEETPSQAVFLAPPEDALFRAEAQRAQVVNWKSFPFHPSAMLEWKERMDQVCQGDLFELAEQGDRLASCQEAYHGAEASTIEAIAERYDACWILTTNASYPFEQAHRSGDWIVYQRPGCP